MLQNPLARGADLMTVHDNLRHASVSTTSIYPHTDRAKRAGQMREAFSLSQVKSLQFMRRIQTFKVIRRDGATPTNSKKVPTVCVGVAPSRRRQFNSGLSGLGRQMPDLSEGRLANFTLLGVGQI